MSLEPQPAAASTGTPPPAVDPVAKVRALARPVAELRAALLARVEESGASGEGARLVADAFDFAVQAHGEQLRASGEAYVTHPAEAALILADLGLDAATLAAALLHDVPEDTSVTTAEIGERFGDEVALLVDGVTKLSKFSALSAEEQHAENIRKMFLAMAQDIRVVLIKLGDRLHNMRTLAALPVEKQRRIARQTLEIYAPLAERLGIWQMKWELEDLSFKAVEPDRYKELARLVDMRRDARADYVERAIAVLRPELERAGITAEFSGRAKHLYSIHKKMARKGSAFSEIYDVYAVRVIVENLRDCYAALGAVHSVWRPIPGQFDDYIAVPKNNLYQSLHTAVVALDGRSLEVQIRTRSMHEVAEVGIAAHWHYKDGTRSDAAYDAKLAWLRQLLEWQRDVTDASEFLEGVRLDVFQDQVYVFTPKGDVKELPAGATPLDFAYLVHTDVGHRCIGAKVNNRLVPLEYRLKSGDIVEVVTARGKHGPSRDWLNIVNSRQARDKIRGWFKHQERDENVTHGRESLERELRRLARSSIEAVGRDKIEEVAKALNQGSVDDLFAAIGYGAIGPQQVVSRLGVAADDARAILPLTGAPASIAPAERTGGIRVKGVPDLLTRFGRCCRPLPGDPIVGYITRGKGVTVHLESCTSSTTARESSRAIEVEWEVAAATAESYPVTIRIDAIDRTGLLSEITQVVAEQKVNILAASVATIGATNAQVLATLAVGSISELARLMARIERVRGVRSVSREQRQ
ncbi:MAG: bifunctional (p)ppGpp synthetase/guanosine-3',5'-bis(diphosphate) 3'-pyrophosphohydrolase [Chloroflexi bacterium]|nr:MAG: bifunctional (p)ppGpp synthetase/guanosine-3',5'-bis(diphosphate) 3'-pyrophosphohydrolase [Chloroflexota bacterium]RLT29232.1 MAG: bifunctional (p)ppGpp synthetase/guanosine-3',5'-bis(diphosphate) 3'-pyrophosphohydrolase [Chloroflexota bacterium]